MMEKAKAEAKLLYDKYYAHAMRLLPNTDRDELRVKFAKELAKFSCQTSRSNLSSLYGMVDDDAVLAEEKFFEDVEMKIEKL